MKRSVAWVHQATIHDGHDVIGAHAALALIVLDRDLRDTIHPICLDLLNPSGVSRTIR